MFTYLLLNNILSNIVNFFYHFILFTFLQFLTIIQSAPQLSLLWDLTSKLLLLTAWEQEKSRHYTYLSFTQILGSNLMYGCFFTVICVNKTVCSSLWSLQCVLHSPSVYHHPSNISSSLLLPKSESCTCIFYLISPSLSLPPPSRSLPYIFLH